MSESKVGNKKGQKIPWEELKFERLKVENEAVSKCSICNIILYPNGRKKSHCMLSRRAACSQLRLCVKIV